jgi:hypothetical protein
VPSEAVSLALAASIYPPALAAIIALGRGQDVRLRVVVFVGAAYLTVLVTGTLILVLFGGSSTTQHQVATPAAGAYVLAGIALLVIAARLRRPRPKEPTSESSGPSRTDRYLQSRWLVAVLALILYVVPSPIYIGGIKAIADTNASSATQFSYLALMLVIMLWLIELPALLVIAVPDRAVGALERINAWFGRHRREVLVLLAAVLGVYLIAVGVGELVG